MKRELSETRKILSQPDDNSIIYANLIPALGFSHMTFSFRDEFLPNRRPTIANWRATDHAARPSKDPAQCYSARLVFWQRLQVPARRGTFNTI
ncbi:hypothetical protein J3F84DRAFT_356627 [Trichoderma pleuroticola]